jgi:replicative DNA helicase
MTKKYEKKIHASAEAEQIVVASCMLPDAEVSQKAFDDVIQIIDESDFHFEDTRTIFGVIKEIVNKGGEVNEISVSEALRKKGLLDDLGGISIIYSVMDACETTTSTITSAKIIKERSNARKLIRNSRLLIEKLDGGAEADEAKAFMEGELSRIDGLHNEDVSLGNVGSSFIEQVEMMRKGEYHPRRIPTGIKHLDEKLPEGGIGDGEVMVISAPTSCGKSQLALNIALRVAIREGKGVGVFSLEMPSDQVFKRMVQISSARNIEEANKSDDKETAFKPIIEATEKIKKSPIYVYNHIKSVSDLRAKCRNMKRKHDVSMIVVDYLQLIPWNPKLAKHDGIAEVSHNIKQMAMELNIPVILLAQVNREGAKRGKLSIYDLKDSGDIENDADIILMMWPTNYDMVKSKKLDKTGKPYIDLSYSLVKNREGERDIVDKFIFDNTVGRLS